MFDVNKIRQDFAMIRNHPNLIYFDSAATSFKPDCVVSAIEDYYCHNTVNIHRGDYDLSFKISTLYDETRKTAQRFLNAESEKEIVFTSGATASLNTVAYGYGERNLKEGDIILLTKEEHASNVLPWYRTAQKTKAVIDFIPLDQDGMIDVEALRQMMNDRVKVLAVNYVSNVMGKVQPIREICRIAHQYNAVVSVDGAQAVPHIPMDVQKDGLDFLSFSAHKMCGPSGVGVLYGKMDLLEKCDPLLLGGGSNARFDSCGMVMLKDVPECFEAGTPNIEGTLGLKAAMEYLMDIGMDNIAAYDKELVEYIEQQAKSLNNIEVYNPHSDIGLFTFNVKGVFAQDAAGYFNQHGIAVRTGNHCAKILPELLGTAETIRASFYFYNTKEEIDRFLKVVEETTIEKCIGVFI